MIALRHSVLIWWSVSVAGALAVASPLLPWFDVLRWTRFDSVPQDFELLFERLFVGSTRAQTLSASALLESTSWQLLLWRVLLLAPMAVTMAVLTQSSSASADLALSRAATRAFTRLPAFASITFVVQALALVGGSLGAGYAAHRLTTSAPGVFDAVVGITLSIASVLFVCLCLTILDVARLSMFRRSEHPASNRGLTGIIDALESLRRYGWRLVATVVGYWAASLIASVSLAFAGTLVSAAWPNGFGSMLAWVLGQLGVGLALICRIASWSRVWRQLNGQREQRQVAVHADREPAPHYDG